MDVFKDQVRQWMETMLPKMDTAYLIQKAQKEATEYNPVAGVTVRDVSLVTVDFLSDPKNPFISRAIAAEKNLPKTSAQMIWAKFVETNFIKNKAKMSDLSAKHGKIVDEMLVKFAAAPYEKHKFYGPMNKLARMSGTIQASHFGLIVSMVATYLGDRSIDEAFQPYEKFYRSSKHTMKIGDMGLYFYKLICKNIKNPKIGFYYLIDRNGNFAYFKIQNKQNLDKALAGTEDLKALEIGDCFVMDAEVLSNPNIPKTILSEKRTVSVRFTEFKMNKIVENKGKK